MRSNNARSTRRSTCRCPVAGILALVVAGCGSGGEGSAPIDDPPLLVRPEAGVMGDGRLGEILDYVVADTGVPAVTATFMHEGAILEQAAAGVRSVGTTNAVAELDKWHIGSLTKSLTSTLAAVLVEAGLISWNTTIADVFPELVGTIDPGYLDTRLDELLSHTGGVSTSSSSLADAVAREGGTLRSQRELFTQRVLAMPPEQPRGTFAYSNAGYIVAGAILERITSTDWEELIAAYVFTPLGMHDSGFGAPGTPGANDQPTGHIPDASGWHSISADSTDADNPAVFGPAGTVHSTLADLASYMSAHLAGANGLDMPGFLSAASFAKLHQPMSDSQYALGWNVSEISLHHVGSNNRWFGQIVLVPEPQIAIFIATNSADPNGPEGGEPNRALLEVQRFFQARFDAAFPAN